MRAAHARGHAAHGYLRALSEEEREDYRVLTKVGRYRRAEALRIIGRGDLAELRPPAPGPKTSLGNREIESVRFLKS